MNREWIPRPQAVRQIWPFLATFGVLVLVTFPTTEGIVSRWLKLDESYSHGFLLAGVSLFLTARAARIHPVKAGFYPFWLVPLTACFIVYWQRHPEWPKLILVSQHLEPTSCFASNIEIKPTLTSNELIALWAQAGFAILPSEVEGYGQTLAESMANGCITITTDAAPMNELVEEDRGFLAEVERKLTFRLGTRYFVSEQALERSIQTAIDQQPDTLENMSRLAIEWYLTNHEQFLSRLEHQLNGLAAPPLDQSAQESPGR